MVSVITELRAYSDRIPCFLLLTCGGVARSPAAASLVPSCVFPGRALRLCARGCGNIPPSELLRRIPIQR